MEEQDVWKEENILDKKLHIRARISNLDSGGMSRSGKSVERINKESQTNTESNTSFSTILISNKKLQQSKRKQDKIQEIIKVRIDK